LPHPFWASKIDEAQERFRGRIIRAKTVKVGIVEIRADSSFESIVGIESVIRDHELHVLLSFVEPFVL
jgi:hypothetical protein